MAALLLETADGRGVDAGQSEDVGTGRSAAGTEATAWVAVRSAVVKAGVDAPMVNIDMVSTLSDATSVMGWAACA